MGTAGLVVLATSCTWLTCRRSQSKGLVHWFFQVCQNLFYHSNATTLSSNWNAVQWKHDIYLSSIQKAIFCSHDWEQQTSWPTLRQILRICPSDLSLLTIVTPRSSISSWIGITWQSLRYCKFNQYFESL